MADETRLPNLQRTFAAVVRGGGSAEAAAGVVVPGGRLDGAGALRVYRDGYLARLTEALGETFEAVWWTLGDEDFFSVCRDYIGQHPSHSYNLSDYGEDFPDFAGASRQADGVEFLRDLARFEWRFKELFHAPEHTSASGERMALLAGAADARITLGEAVLLFQSPFAVLDLWSLRKSDQSVVSLPEMARAQSVLAYKQASQTYAREVTAAEFAVLVELREGASLAASLARAEALDPSFQGEAVARFFHSIAACGLVAGVEVLPA